MRHITRLLPLLLAVVVLTLPFAVQADGPVTARAGRAEVRFLQGMIDHHQMALDMAADCLTKAKTESVRALCQNIITAQDKEIKLMRGWLLSWYQIDYTPMSMMHMMDMMKNGGMMMGGMHGGQGGQGGHGGMMGNMPDDPPMMMGMMAGLSRLEGVAYEVAWLEAMIDHHDDALHMAQRVMTQEVHKETRELAEAIIKAQTAEIDQMEAMIKELSK
jgi:uncharacterized protein (DUF305 family)